MLENALVNKLSVFFGCVGRFSADLQAEDPRQGVQRRRQLYAEGARGRQPDAATVVVQERGVAERGWQGSYRTRRRRTTLVDCAANETKRLRRL